MSLPLFGRRWSLAISQPNQPQALLYTSELGQGHPLRFEFQIERTLHSDANKAKFALTNLSRAHRSAIGPGSTVVLRAGYGSKIDILFRGTVAKATTDMANADIVTEVEAGDGEPYLTSGHVHLSYRTTTTLARILQDICQRLSLTIAGQVYTYGSHQVQNVPRVTLPRRVISGPIKQVLDNLLHPLGIIWSIQCGTLLIQGQQGVVTLNAQVLGSETGLIGIPSVNATGVMFRSLILPTIAPGLAVTLRTQSKETSGNFRVVSVRYSGDTHGPDWSLEAEAQKLTYPLAFYVKESSQLDFEAAQQEASDQLDAEDGGEG